MEQFYQHSTDEKLTNFRLSKKKRFYYALGDFGYNFMYYWISTYLMIYYTDTIGISAGTVSIMMLIVRIFDAVNDPIIGSMADRTKSKWGRYRPWFLIGSIAMTAFIVLTFAASPDWSYNKRLIWMWSIYLLLTIASTCSNMPYGALNGCITPDSEDRAKVSALRMMFANTSSMVTVIIAVPLIRAFSASGSVSDAKGYFGAVLITCILGLPTMIICCFNTKEVITPPPTQTSIPLKSQVKSLINNRPVLILVLGQFFLGCVLYGRAAMLSYYWQYNAGNASYATIYGWISLFAAIVGTGWVGNYLFHKIKHKGIVCSILNFLTAGTYFLMYYQTTSSVLFWILNFFASMFFYAYMGVHFGAIGDAVDYGEYISFVRCDGFLSSIVSVANKAGGAVMPAIGAAVLSALHYTANVSQPQEILSTINWFITMIPALISVVNGILYLFYPISTQKHKSIIDELIKRRL